MADVKSLYERMRATPWPVLASRVGDFALYESLLAGCADRIVRGGLSDVSKIPTPDEETVATVNKWLARGERSTEEEKFLEYFDLLEELRLLLVGQSKR